MPSWSSLKVTMQPSLIDKSWLGITKSGSIWSLIPNHLILNDEIEKIKKKKKGNYANLRHG